MRTQLFCSRIRDYAIILPLQKKNKVKKRFRTDGKLPPVTVIKVASSHSDNNRREEKMSRNKISDVTNLSKLKATCKEFVVKFSKKQSV
ncbi:hypothetical protein AQUCO_01000633v1 [Aquilegia coerulea]|uniref:Uncharacterized protein n=1 Tax=Aquilegia coerulea TaxID=218851 RepID=A0A2G5EAV7_AQUCA|nr:hypothetical protein AQUCO_01000633v1 [Aquilegia coerulea]